MELQIFKLNLFPSVNLVWLIAKFGAVAAIFFIYICLLFFWNDIIRIVAENNIFDDIRTIEKIVYAAIAFVSMLFMFYAFTKSQAFYGSSYSFDLIYTSDSPSLVKGNVYLWLTHPENDLRQPLFAVFAAPFVGLPYLLTRHLPLAIQAMLMNCVQVVLLLIANFMLAKIMNLSAMKRICFMLLSSFTYTYLLFILIMEQYIIAYFWLTFFLYLVFEKKQPERIALWGAGGTLITSMIFLPFLSQKSPLRNFTGWIWDTFRHGFEFTAVMLLFGRFDVIYTLQSRITSLLGFTGQNLTLTDKALQYIAFVKSCFFAPDAGRIDMGLRHVAFDHISWQLDSISQIDKAGMVILALICLSIWLNRKKKSALVAAGWVGFSLIILLFLGWGTGENGLILYSLYFGWGFLVLLFQLIEAIEVKLRTHLLTPIVSAGCSAILLASNIPAICELLDFAVTYYPA